MRASKTEGQTHRSTWQSLCHRCASPHALPVEAAGPAADRLAAQLARVARGEGTPTDSVEALAGTLFEPGGGKMFGVLLAVDAEGQRHEHRAFSGMFGGRWTHAGWAGPAFDVEAWRGLEARYDPEIAACTSALANADAPTRRRLLTQRAELSRALMGRYHALYRWLDGGGRRRSLAQLAGPHGLASGMGDCCGPKLVQAAHARGQRPVALAEIFVGRARQGANGVVKRRHGQGFAPCEERCVPILGCLLCDCP